MTRSAISNIPIIDARDHFYHSYRVHYNDVIMSTMASQITDVSIVYLTVPSGADQRKHQSSASLAFVWGIHRWSVNSPHKGPVTRKMFPFYDVIMRMAEVHAGCMIQCILLWNDPYVLHRGSSNSTTMGGITAYITTAKHSPLNPIKQNKIFIQIPHANFVV